MKKNNKIWLFSGLMIVLMVTGYFFFIRETTVFGSTVLSLDQIDLKSSYSPLDGKVWVYTFVQGGLGQYAQYTVNPSEVSEKFSGDELPEESFYFKVNYLEQHCEYPIKTETVSTVYFDGQLREWKLEQYGRILSCDTSQDKWEQECGVGWRPELFYSDVGFSEGCNIVCSKKDSGAIGRMDNPQINNKFEIIVESKNERYSKIFETQGESKGLLDDNAPVYISWDGNLNTGKQCPDQAPFKTAYMDGKWKIIDESDYDNYVDEVDNFYSISLDLLTDDNVEDKLDGINYLKNRAENPESFGTIENSASLNSGLVINDIENQDLARPVITAFIEADWIGIITPIGKPKIIKVDDIDFGSGADTKVKILVENIGDDLGTFNMFGSCDNSNIDIYESKTISVQKGDRQTVYLGITGDVSQDTSTQCKITAKGTEYSDTETFTARVTIAGQICDPNQESCNLDGNIYKCNSDGSSENLFEDCDDGCTNDELGRPYCKEDTPPPPPPANIWDKIKEFFKDLFDGTIFSGLKSLNVVLGIISTIIVFLYTKEEILSDQAKKDTINTILLIVLSILIGYFVYVTFWTALIIFVFFLVIKQFIPSVKIK